MCIVVVTLHVYYQGKQIRKRSGKKKFFKSQEKVRNFIVIHDILEFCQKSGKIKSK